MHKVPRLLLSFLMFTPHLYSQVLPKENGTLNYRIIGFSFPPTQKDNNYKIEIALGNYNTEDSFKAHIVKSVDAVNNKVIAEVPSFGVLYTWRVFTGNNSQTTDSPFHHFSTAVLPEVDTNTTRLRITKPAEKYKDDYVFLDANKALYDMSGQPIWFLPDVKGVKADRTIFCDLKATPQGTITFINDEGLAFEVNYDGVVLWSAPNNSHINRYTSYHHEFTRLNNGHYMVLGFEAVYLKPLPPPAIKDDLLIDDSSKIRTLDAGYRKDVFGTLIEYDEKGNIVWSWKTSKYGAGSDLYFNTSALGKHRYDVHENAFYFDEKNKVIYVSLRNISRIVKLQYPSGKVLADYGEIYKRGVAEKGNGLFCGQHGIRRSQKGYLYLYNNNVCNHSGHLPKIIMMQEPLAKKGRLKKIWEYECTIEDEQLKNKNDFGVSTGGNVLELPGNSLFVSMSSQYSKLFIIGLDKKILWSALPERRTGNQWNVVPQYRASIINREELEKLVWNGETTK